MKPTIVQAAKLLTKDGDVPDWLVEELWLMARLIRGEKDKPGDGDVSLAIAVIDVLEHELSVVEAAEETFGLETDERVEVASNALYELREFFEELRVHRGKGGPMPDGRRKLCAAVCADIWKKLWGEVQPYSPKLQQACELYWLACGHSESSSEGGELRSWERLLVATPN
jgi:hypothetical protein